jgi:hypothetical protein
MRNWPCWKPVSDPVKTYVYGFRALLADMSFAGIVGLNWSGNLQVTHFLQSGFGEHGVIFGIGEKGATFSFSGGGGTATICMMLMRVWMDPLWGGGLALGYGVLVRSSAC